MAGAGIAWIKGGLILTIDLEFLTRMNFAIQ